MARYTDAVCRLCRREGLKLFLKGSRCYTKKCSFERRPTPPGQHGVRRRKVGDYGLQLREKQKVRRVYGVLEKQFRNYFVEASRHSGVTGEYLLRSLELRLDNVVYRLRIGDKVEVRESHRGRELFKTVKETLRSHQAPDWLSLDAANLAGSVLAMPRRDQMPLDFNEQLVVEYYSR
ncbi:MAG: hypothetical protein A2V85_16445 [Chloroflexi bacterium RBG_16_72_14]|nr:MAG: hypothetical protein A2V85_16445 [Chloroflexi bacterium RBG_16_72_14]